MAGTELRRPDVRPDVVHHRGRLRGAAIAFEHSTSAVEIDPAAWSTAVEGALGLLADAWEDHVSFTEGSGGLFEDLLGETVEVAAEVDRLRRDHEVVVAHIARAHELLAQSTAGPEDTRVLLALAGIAKQVDQHRRRGADLLYRVYSVDVSTGD